MHFLLVAISDVCIFLMKRITDAESINELLLKKKKQAEIKKATYVCSSLKRILRVKKNKVWFPSCWQKMIRDMKTYSGGFIVLPRRGFHLVTL